MDVPLSTPDVGELEQEYVLAAMQSGWVAPAGPDLEAFEAEVAERVGVPYAVAVSSGTAALHLALVSWGVGPGDVVPVSTLTFAATVNAIRYVGATPHFVDVHGATGNVNADLLRKAIGDLRSRGARVAAVIPVDLFGTVADVDAVTEVCGDIPILWDAAESFGARHRGRAAGSAGHAAVLSFNGNKIMTTSGGGMLLSRDDALVAHARKLSTQAREPVAHYEHREVGFNYRMSNILAALGRAQLTRLDALIERRRAWRRRYLELFSRVPGIEVLGAADSDEANCWLTAITVDPSSAGVSAKELSAHLAAAGIETRPIWKPMHLQPVYAGCDGTLDGTADRLFASGLTLPSGSALSDEQFGHVQQALAEKLVC